MIADSALIMALGTIILTRIRHIIILIHPQASTMRFDGFFRNEDEPGHPLRDEDVPTHQPPHSDRNDAKQEGSEETGFYDDHQSLEQFVDLVRNDLFRYGLGIAIARDTGLLTFSPKLVGVVVDDVDDDWMISTSSPKMTMSMTSEVVQKKKTKREMMERTAAAKLM